MNMVRRVATALFVIATLLPVAALASPPVRPGEFVVSLPDSTANAARRLPRGFSPLGIGRHHITLRQNAAGPESAGDPCVTLLDRLPHGSTCSPNYIYQLDRTPNDPYFTFLNGLQTTTGVDVDAPEAWELATGSRSVIVATIDSGIDYTHPELAANMWRNPREVPGNNVDDDGNGLIDDVFGANMEIPNGDPIDIDGHGTHVAGTIGALGDNSVGVVGVNWQVRIMSLAVFAPESRGGGASLSDIVAGLDYIVHQKELGENIVAVNASFGSSGFSAPFEQAVERLRDVGILLVASAGNSNPVGLNNDVTPRYPASYNVENVIAVSAVDSAGQLASFSHYGPTSVDLAAPGVQILSTFPNGQFVYLDGTSMAAPHVSGAIALLSAYRPGLPPLSMRSMVLSSALPLGTLSGKVATGGMLNIARLLTEPTPPANPTPTPSPTPTPVGTTILSDGQFEFLQLGAGPKFKRRFRSSKEVAAEIVREDFTSRPGKANARLFLTVNGVQCRYFGSLSELAGLGVRLSGRFRGAKGRNLINLLIGNEEAITDSASVTILPKPGKSARARRSQAYVDSICKRFLESVTIAPLG